MSVPVKTACERCASPLPPGSPDARVCSHLCTFCSACAVGPLRLRCPNCGGGLERRAPRVALPERSARPACVGASPYVPRRRRGRGLLEHAGWRVKRYALWHPEREEPDPEALAGADALAAGVLDRAAGGGLGFLVLHHGRDGDYLLVDWWSDEDILNQRLLVRPSGEARFREAHEATWVACVWELEILAGERDAWVATAMARPPGSYLERWVGDR